MVNKYLLTLAGVVLIAVFGMGVLVGTQIDSGPVDSIGEPTGPVSTPTDGATATAAATTTGTSTPEAVTTDVPASSFNETLVAVRIAEQLNDRREAEGVSLLTTTGVTAQRLQWMASNHSDAMAAAGEVNHSIDGRDSYDRYQEYDLVQTCEFSATGESIESPTNNRLEAVGSTVAGQPYTEDGQQRFNGNESAVASALVDDWLSTLPYSNRLTLDNAQRVGVGVTVTEAGDVYATVNICG